MKLLIAFFKDKTREISLYAGTVGIFIVVAFLYNIRMDALKYALLLVILWLLLYVITEYHRFRKKHLLLERFKKSTQECTKELPECRNLLELDYQELLGIFDEKILELKSEARIKGQDLSDYYGMWVHQIKTPIAALKLLIEEEVDIPGEEEPLGEDRERLQQQREKRRDEELQQLFAIEQYVNMALSYMRLGSETTDFVLRQTDLDGVVRMAVRRYARHFISKKITLHYEETGARVLTDEKWLGFVIEQLLSNALKYTHEGSITIGMEKGRLTITDTGIGIRAEDLPRVCEKGYTGYNGHANQKSTGIGLYLCSTILKKLGHSFTITSQEGTGTRVTIGFPEES